MARTLVHRKPYLNYALIVFGRERSRGATWVMKEATVTASRTALEQRFSYIRGQQAHLHW